MICETKEPKKQRDGFLILSQVLSPQVGSLDKALPAFNKSLLNPIMQVILTTVKQNDILSDCCATALKCLHELLNVVYTNYDQRLHQPVMTALHTLTGVAMRKLEGIV